MIDTEARAQSSTRADLSVLVAARQHLWLVIAIVVFFTVGSVLVARARAATYVAEAVIILEDPASADLLGSRSTPSPERLVANRLAVLESGVVARRASEIAAADGIDLSPEDIAEVAEFLSARDSDQIVIVFEADSEEGAVIATQAIIEAYREVQVEQRRTESLRVLERLYAAQEVLLDDLSVVNAAIEERRSLRQLDQLSLDALDRLVTTQALLAAATDPETIESLTAELDRIGAQIEVLQVGVAVEAADPELDALLRNQDLIRSRLEILEQRTSELEIDAESASSGIAFEDSAALVTDQGGVGTLFTAAAGGFLGLLVALGAAYQLAGRRATYADRFEPNRVLGLQFLGDVPEFPGDSAVPSRDDPRSPGAEAVRFATGNLQLALERTSANTVMFVSTGVGEGKSTMLSNIALAAARAGGNVLVIDADFGNQATSELLLGEIPVGPGLTELGSGQLTLREAVVEADAGMGVTVDVLSRGQLPILAPEFFSLRALPAIVDRIATVYSLVLIDGPPLLQVAYANNVARIAKAVVAVISHESSIARSEELVDRLRFVDVEVLGYLYNRGPMRPEFLESGGSMRDVLGDRGFDAPVAKRRPR